MLNILVACEFSDTVSAAFRAKGHQVLSCDLLPSDGNGQHYQGDIFDVLYDGWDMMIAHPPCTWLCQAMRTNAARKDRPKISEVFEDERKKAFDFVMRLWNSGIKRIALENPIGYLNQKDVFRKPDQIARPWMFGHEYKKDVCLWLNNLPKLEPTNIVEGPYKKLDFWSNKRNQDGKSKKSVTFQGIAEAMAEQWG